MGHVAKHSAGAGSNWDRSEPASKPGEPAETPAEPVAVKPGDRAADPTTSVVVEPMDAPAAAPERPDRSRRDDPPPARPERPAAAETPVVRPNMPDRNGRRWWHLGRADDEQRPVSHAAGAKSRPKPDERRSTDRYLAPGGSGDRPSRQDELRSTDRYLAPGGSGDRPDGPSRRPGPATGSGGTGWERGPDAAGGVGRAPNAAGGRGDEPDPSAWSRPGSRGAGSRRPAAPTAGAPPHGSTPDRSSAGAARSHGPTPDRSSAGAARSHRPTPDRSSSDEATPSRGGGDRREAARDDRGDSAKGGLETFRGDAHRSESARSHSAAERIDAVRGDREAGPTGGSLDALRSDRESGPAGIDVLRGDRESGPAGIDALRVDQAGSERSGAGSSPSHRDGPPSDAAGSGWPRGAAIGPEPAPSWSRVGSADVRSTQAASKRSDAVPNAAGSDILGLDASLTDTAEHVLVASGPVGLTATEQDGGPDADETTSPLRPTAPLGTPTYEGTSADDTAKLPRIGHAIQAERIWTKRPEPETNEAEKAKDGKYGKYGKYAKKIDVTSLTDVGMKLLPEVEPGAPDGPVTNARWAALVRAIARRLTWTLPAAGVIAAAASIGAMVRGGPAHYLTGAEPFRLFAWVASVWLGVVAMTCLVGLLAAVRSRGTAFTGLMLGIFGGISMLMFAAVPPATPLWGLSAKTLALTCGGIYSAGWMAMGWAIFRSRMFSRGDGLLLVLCGPMVGFAGLWMSPFHTAGALLMIAAGLGIAWKSNSTLRAVRAGRAEDANRTADDEDDDTAAAAKVHLDDLVTSRRRERDRDAKDREAKNRDAHDQDAKKRGAKKRGARKTNAKDPNAKDRDASGSDARDRDASGWDGRNRDGREPNAIDAKGWDGRNRDGHDPNAKAPNAMDPNAKDRDAGGWDGRNRDAHDPNAKDRDSSGWDGRNRDAHDPNAKDRDASGSGARNRDAHDLNAKGRDARHRDERDRKSDAADDGDAKAGRRRRLGWGRKSESAKQPDQPKPTPAKPASPAPSAAPKDEKPAAAPRGPGKRRLRIGALTTEPPSATTSDEKPKR
jgi:hypothetical protein